MRDVACAGYVAGCNTRWFAKDEDGNFTSDQAALAIQDRLSFAHDDTDRYASMLAFPCYEGQFESGQLDTVMSVTTRLLPWEVNNSGLHGSFPGGQEAYAVYSGALQLGQVHYGEDMKAAGSRRRLKPCPLATSADRPPACVPLQRTRTSFPRDLPTYAQATQPTCLACCSLLTRALPSPVTRTQPAFLVPAVATTRSRARSCPSCRARASTPCHARIPRLLSLLTTSRPTRLRSFGPDAIPGDARWRRGESVSLKTARDSMVSLECAALPLKQSHLALPRDPRLTRHPFLVQAGAARADGLLGPLSERRACRSPHPTRTIPSTTTSFLHLAWNQRRRPRRRRQ